MADENPHDYDTTMLEMLEIIWGDGKSVHRKIVDLSQEEAFSAKTLRVGVEMRGAKWVRFEAWDIAANGTFSQPVWVE